MAIGTPDAMKAACTEVRRQMQSDSIVQHTPGHEEIGEQHQNEQLLNSRYYLHCLVAFVMTVCAMIMVFIIGGASLGEAVLGPQEVITQCAYSHRDDHYSSATFSPDISLKVFEGIQNSSLHVANWIPANTPIPATTASFPSYRLSILTGSLRTRFAASAKLAITPSRQVTMVACRANPTSGATTRGPIATSTNPTCFDDSYG